jgi:hypothetical protein
LKHQISIVLVAILILSIVFMLLAHEDPFARKLVNEYTGWHPVVTNARAYYKILYDLSVASLTSLIFYFLVVYIPESQRRKRLRRSLEGRYKVFREDCIRIMLGVANRTFSEDPSVEVEALTEPEEFRRYFHERVTPDRERWHELWNNITEDDLSEIRVQMELLRDEISFVLNNMDIPKDEPFEFLRNLYVGIYTMMHVTLGYDELTPFARSLWWMFTGWSAIDGQTKGDPIKRMIDTI